MASRLTLRLAAIILAVVAALAAAWWLYGAITAKPKAEARLGRNQAEAALESGREAVNTVGAAADREAASEALTRSNEAEIRAAPGAADPVAAEARAAGLSALCRRAAYKDDPRCVQPSRSPSR